MRLTNELVEAGKSRNGGWSEEQLECLGVAWPPEKGWKEQVIGKVFSDDQLERFLTLRDAHLSEV